ncbi:MAG: RNA-binding domain-containing protein [Candidatus Woesearchaeota archaeon]
MKYAHTIEIRVFVNPQDNEDFIRNTFIKLLSLDPKKENVKINRSSALGFNEKKIVILEAQLVKDRHISTFLDHLNYNLKREQKNLLLRQTNRLDDNLNFFIRFDKDKLLNNEYFIIDHGNCFHIRINIAAFPRSREAAIKVIGNIFKD